MNPKIYIKAAEFLAQGHTMYGCCHAIIRSAPRGSASKYLASFKDLFEPAHLKGAIGYWWLNPWLLPRCSEARILALLLAAEVLEDENKKHS